MARARLNPAEMDMKIGLSYDLKEEVTAGQGGPDDALEEYDSPETVAAIAATVRSLGHDVSELGGGRQFLARILREEVDLVFNIAEGRGTYRSREAQVPSVLEMLDIPYTGSDPLCLALCLDKPLTKKIVALAGIPTPRWQVIRSSQELRETRWDDFSFPVFIKPAYEGSSKGIRLSSLAENAAKINEIVLPLLKSYRQPVMVEEFIAGDEITVGVVGNCPPRVLGIMRVLPRERNTRFVYSLEIKRDWERLVTYECPAQLEAGVLQRIHDLSLKAFEVLGCRDISRLDFRISPEGVPYFLEINPLPGLNPRSSDLPIMFNKVGLSYNALIASILHSAVERYPQCCRR